MDAEGDAEDDQDDHADDGDGGVLPVQVGAGAFLDGGGDLLHAGGAGIGGEHLAAGDQAVDQRQQTADDDHDISKRHPVNPLGQPVRPPSPARIGALGAAAVMKARRVCQNGVVRQIPASPRVNPADRSACIAGPGSGTSVRRAPVAQLVRAGRS